MTLTKLKNTLLSLLFLYLPGSSIHAEDIKLLSLGDALPTINYINQFDKQAPIPNETEKILFISDMDASKITHPLFLKEGDDYLLKFKTIIISDINRMPSLISKFVAIPKMREYPYTLRLIREEKIGDPFPRTKGLVTCIELKADLITKIEFHDTEQTVRNFIENSPNTKLKK